MHIHRTCTYTCTYVACTQDLTRLPSPFKRSQCLHRCCDMIIIHTRSHSFSRAKWSNDHSINTITYCNNTHKTHTARYPYQNELPFFSRFLTWWFFFSHTEVMCCMNGVGTGRHSSTTRAPSNSNLLIGCTGSIAETRISTWKRFDAHA